jgi:exodeoxyribonuclease V beta subunit
MPEKFNTTTVDLIGQNIVEASAGTGKTYSITGLFLRFLVEEEMPIEKILTVTFTKAATSELKAKIRGRITEALEYINSGGTGNAEIDCIKNKNNSSELLRKALLNFDDAAVYTIHSFCGRMLKENAFESGIRFDSEIVDNDMMIIDQIAEDFWRREIVNGSRLLLEYFITNKITIDNFKTIVKNKINFPGLEIIPSVSAVNIDELDGALSKKLAGIKKMWNERRNEIISKLGAGSGINRQSYTSKIVGEMITLMDNLDADNFDADNFDNDRFQRFAQSYVSSKPANNDVAPADEFFGLCEEFLFPNPLHQVYVAFCRKLADETGRLRSVIAEKNRVRTSGDLIADLSRAIDSDAGAKLVTSIRNKFGAALIDEFQDTDPLQWNIFNKVFLDGNRPLFLIGDPKQSIYKFRGADVNSYFAASDAVNDNKKFTLKYNYRSEKNLIAAVNLIFNFPESFHTKKIAFDPAEYPAEKVKEERLEIDGKNEQAPFSFWFIDKVNNETLSSSQAELIIENAVVGEIVRLLNLKKEGKLKYYEYDSLSRMEKEINFSAGKIAVLVRTNKQGRSMCAALRMKNIPAVMVDKESVYKSEEAIVMERLLAAIVSPKDLSLLRAALATGLFGAECKEVREALLSSGKSELELKRFCAAEIDELSENESQLSAIIEKIFAYELDWRKNGFFGMFKRFLAENRAVEELLKYRDGERRVTNILHLAELLNKESSASALSPDGLLKYLRGRMQDEQGSPEESELRMESDENAVQVVTSHKSKGMQYPVVFCPYLWRTTANSGKNNPPVFHEERRIKMDMGSDNIEENTARWREEELEDDLRLAYVALTRAKSRCYMAWGYINKTSDSALFYLFHTHRNTESADTNAFDLKDDLQKIFSGNEKLISFSDIPEKNNLIYAHVNGDNTLSLRTLSRIIERPDHLHSFTEMSSGQRRIVSSADRDEFAEDNEFPSSGSANTILNLRGGAATGQCLHSIFENISFQKNKNDEIIVNLLAEYGFDTTDKQCVDRMIDDVLGVKLIPGDDEFSLSMLTDKEKIHEVEFYYPVVRNVRETMARALDNKNSDPEDAGNTLIKGGYMTGFIDMIFRHNGKYYLVDWKSNKAGQSRMDYTPERLKNIMEADRYNMQLAIYTVALDCYLAVTKKDYDYDKDFGGVFYIFLRGVSSSDSSTGIYFEKPAKEKLNGLKSKILSVNK